MMTNTDAPVGSPTSDDEALARVWGALAATEDDRRWDALRDWLDRPQPQSA